MYCFAKICCLCLQHSPELTKLDELDQNGYTFFEKLIVLIPGFEGLVKKSIPNYLCRRCRRYLNKFYKFQQNCLKSYQLLESYVNQLDSSIEEEKNEEAPPPQENIIEDDLILIKEDMKECLKNMNVYIKVENDGNDSTTTTATENSPATNGTENYRRRTRETSKKISYNEDYNSDSMFSDSEVYLTKSAKRKRTKTRKELNKTRKDIKTVAIPKNSIFAQDLTATINGIITRLSAAGDSTTNNEEVKVKFKNSSGNTEQLSIFRDEDSDSVEIRFTKEEKNGYLKVHHQGDNIILTHNMSASTELTDLLNSCELESQSSCSSSIDNGYMNLSQMSCKICDKVFSDEGSLRKHVEVHAPESSSTCSTMDTLSDEALPIQNGDSPKTSQRCEMKVLLSELPENGIKSERSSSPEFQFHLSDDTDDEFDNDTLILSSLDNENDFDDERSPTPVNLGAHVMAFLNQNDTPGNSVRSADDPQTPHLELLNEKTDNSVEEKYVQVVVNKMEVEHFIKKLKKSKRGRKKKTRARRPKRLRK